MNVVGAALARELNRRPAILLEGPPSLRHPEAFACRTEG
jgi:hypothetical protein